MQAYEAGDFEPRAPVVRATVRGPSNVVYHGVPLLIDTGADVSVIPLEVAAAVEAETRPSNAPIQLLDGGEITCLQANLTVEFLRYRFSGPFLVAGSRHGILGRNILNLLLVTLDGPNLLWSM